MRSAAPLARVCVQAFAAQVAMIRREQDRFAEMEPQVAAVAAALPDVPAWRCGLAFVHAEIGRTDEACQALAHLGAHAFADLPRDGFWQIAMRHVAETCALVGDAERGTAAYDLLAPYAGRHLVVGGAISFGAAARLLGSLAALLERWDEAEAHFEEALAGNARMRAVTWLAHTRFAYARMLAARGRSGDRPRGGALLEDAVATARTHGMARLLALASTLDDGRARRPAAARPALRRAGEQWEIAFAGTVVRMQDVKGLRYLAALVADPGRELHVLDLLALGEGAAPSRLGRPSASGNDGADAQTRRAYRSRLAELETDLAEAEEANDLGRVERAREQIEFLHRELVTAYGLGGLGRSAGSPVEKARKAVYNRLRSALARLDRAHPALARHLSASLRSGTFCAYRPVPLVSWEVVA